MTAQNTAKQEKHVLITNLWISNYAGSELNCLNLATALSDMGYSVEVAVLEAGAPILNDFIAANIPVKQILTDELSHTHYDLIWAHHSIVIDYLLFKKKISADRLILSGLSPFHPFEVLPAYANDASLCLANSEETKAQLVKEGVAAENILVFPNYVDATWLHCSKRRLPKLRPERIAIVSNHVPEELYHAAQQLRAKGCTVDIYGLHHTFVKITPEILNTYDLIVTIGKTVQFSFALQIPVYCYDIHGGPGYIAKEDLQTAAYYNFSGRGFSKKTADQITQEILTKYAMQHKNLSQYRDYILQTSILERNIKNVLSLVESAHINCDEIRRKHYRTERSNGALLEMYAYRKHALELEIALEAERKLQQNADVHALICERDDFSNRLLQIENSRSWKLISKVKRIFEK
ncbi:MAG: hypothetical protein IJD81_07050 [Oscillospiraceae bacterium]|nr:hypothetical protein [Oscillospiraceae bacterium]